MRHSPGISTMPELTFRIGRGVATHPKSRNTERIREFFRRYSSERSRVRLSVAVHVRKFIRSTAEQMTHRWRVWPVHRPVRRRRRRTSRNPGYSAKKSDPQER